MGEAIRCSNDRGCRPLKETVFREKQHNNGFHYSCCKYLIKGLHIYSAVMRLLRCIFFFNLNFLTTLLSCEVVQCVKQYRCDQGAFSTQSCGFAWATVHWWNNLRKTKLHLCRCLIGVFVLSEKERKSLLRAQISPRFPRHEFYCGECLFENSLLIVCSDSHFAAVHWR